MRAFDKQRAAHSGGFLMCNVRCDLAHHLIVSNLFGKPVLLAGTFREVARESTRLVEPARQYAHSLRLQLG
jgi:hypothetical protein